MAEHERHVCEDHGHLITQCRCPGERQPDGTFYKKTIKVACNKWCPENGSSLKGGSGGSR